MGYILVEKTRLVEEISSTFHEYRLLEKLCVYWLQNGLITLALILLLLCMHHPKFLLELDSGRIFSRGFENFFLEWSFLHISWSFLNFRGNPDWIKRILSKGQPGVFLSH